MKRRSALENEPAGDHRRHRMSGRGKALLGVGAAGLVVISSWLAVRSNPTPRSLPVPNGYDHFVRATHRLVRPAGFVHELKPEERDSWVDKNREVLTEVREGLTQRCLVPVEYSEDWLVNTITLRMNLKMVGQVLRAESEAAARRGQTNDAIQSALDLVRYGHGVGRGVMIDWLVGSACELMGLRQLTNVAVTAAAAELRRVVRTLEELESERESKEAVLKEEGRWQRGAFNLLRYLRATWEARSLNPDGTGDLYDFDREYEKRVNEARGTLLQMATWAFQREKGRSPTHELELAPDYLLRLPGPRPPPTPPTSPP